MTASCSKLDQNGPEKMMVRMEQNKKQGHNKTVVEYREETCWDNNKAISGQRNTRHDNLILASKFVSSLNQIKGKWQDSRNGELMLTKQTKRYH